MNRWKFHFLIVRCPLCNTSKPKYNCPRRLPRSEVLPFLLCYSLTMTTKTRGGVWIGDCATTYTWGNLANVYSRLLLFSSPLSNLGPDPASHTFYNLHDFSSTPTFLFHQTCKALLSFHLTPMAGLFSLFLPDMAMRNMVLSWSLPCQVYLVFVATMPLLYTP